MSTMYIATDTQQPPNQMEANVSKGLGIVVIDLWCPLNEREHVTIGVTKKTQ